MISPELGQFFDAAFLYCKRWFSQEVSIVENRHFADITAERFLSEYVYVVLNSGMKNAVAEKVFQHFMAKMDVTVINHLGKRRAVEQALANYRTWFRNLKELDNKLAYLELLPWIGPITKYHLARNLGLDYAKPDRHMIRLAQKHGFSSDVTRMCQELADLKGLRVGTVDVILWRYIACGCP